MFRVIVGNIGMVMKTSDESTARWTFDEYVGQSMRGQGRAAGEPVTLMEGDEILLDYHPVKNTVEA